METLPQRVRRRLGWAIRDRFPMRKVVREVQGVTMTLPWSHRLPDYARVGPAYGQNLVRLAAELGRDGPIQVLDVGANVGDSVLQVLHVTDANVLAVEGDEAYLEFLRINTGDDARVVVVPALLAPDESGAAMRAVRAGGTTRFEPAAGPATTTTVTTDQLRTRHGFDRLRLVKSDTDGYDVALVPAIARTWSDARPVLFFEYDVRLARLAGHDPQQVWSDLEALGYDTAAIWDHGGRPAAPLGDLSRARSLREGGAAVYWDVAVCHRDDADGRAALAAALAPEGGR